MTTSTRTAYADSGILDIKWAEGVIESPLGRAVYGVGVVCDVVANWMGHTIQEASPAYSLVKMADQVGREVILSGAAHEKKPLNLAVGSTAKAIRGYAHVVDLAHQLRLKWWGGSPEMIALEQAQGLHEKDIQNKKKQVDNFFQVDGQAKSAEDDFRWTLPELNDVVAEEMRLLSQREAVLREIQEEHGHVLSETRELDVRWGETGETEVMDAGRLAEIGKMKFHTGIQKDLSLELQLSQREVAVTHHNSDQITMFKELTVLNEFINRQMDLQTGRYAWERQQL